MKKRINIYRLTSQIAGVLFSIAILLLGIRFILRLFGANPNVPFVNWMYETSYVVLSPFVGIFPNSRLRDGFVFEFNTLFAIFIYMILYILVLEVMNFFSNLNKQKQ